MTPLHAADDSSCDVDVVAISGLSGHAFGSFKSKTNEPTYMWLRDSLPSDMPHARIFIYGYDTQMINSDSFQNIGDLGQQLKSDLILMRKTTGSLVNRHLILIGHSLGGIIIKSAINRLSNGAQNDQDIAALIRSVLFFGVPNQGMDTASLIPMVGDRPNRDLIQSLGRESEVLHNLSRSFQTNFNSPRSMLFSFYETRQSPTAKMIKGRWTMSGPSTVLVDRRSATNGRHWEQDDDYLYPVNRTHSEMVKLDSRHDTVHVQILHCLKRFQEGIKITPRDLSTVEQECLKSLSFREQTSRWDEIHTASNTCSWLLHHQSYAAWITAPSGLLWIEGSPGVGKSVLMKYILQALRDTFSQDRYLMLSFFVNGQGTDLEKSKLGLLRAILHQLLCRKPDSLHLILPTYIERSQTMNNWQWGTGELQTILEWCLDSACQSHSVILLVDALDELGKQVALEVVGYFHRLVVPPNKNGLHLRICFSCRHYPAISFGTGHRICVEAENSNDIRQIVASMLSGVTDFHNLLSLITTNAKGVFQWAVLVSGQARSLSNNNRMASHIHREVQKLPMSLYELYSGILESSPRATLRLFQWLCFAKTPISPVALQQALAVSTEQLFDSLEEYEENLGYSRHNDSVESMVNIYSRGLAQVLKRPEVPLSQIPKREHLSIPPEYVGLIHQSVKDFLIDGGGFAQLEMSLSIDLIGLSNAHLSDACFKYQLTQKLPRIMDYREAHYEHSSSQIVGAHFKDYVTKYGLSHLHMANERGYFSEFLLRSIKQLDQRSDRNHLVLVPAQGCSYYQKVALRKIDRYLHWTKTFHHSPLIAMFLAHGASRVSLELFEDNDNSFIPKKDHGRPSLCMALVDRTFENVELLLGIGRTHFGIKDSFGKTILTHAVGLNQLELVKAILVSAEVDPNCQDCFKRTSLSYAAENGFSKIVRVLLRSSRVDPNCPDEDGRTSISYAAKRGSLKIIKALLALPEANPCIGDKNGRTPLSYAAESGSLRATEAFLSCAQIDLNTQDNCGWTPLFFAATRGFLKVTEALLARPQTDPNRRDRRGRTALSYAVENRWLDITKAMFSCSRTDPNLHDNYGRSPLWYAFMSGSLDIIEFLLECPRLDPNSQDLQGRTVLSHASKSGSLEVVTTLLTSAKVDPDHQDRRGRTPLSYASESGFLDVVEVLIASDGVDRNSQDHEKCTPLMYAAEKGNIEVVELLKGE